MNIKYVFSYAYILHRMCIIVGCRGTIRTVIHIHPCGHWISVSNIFLVPILLLDQVAQNDHVRIKRSPTYFIIVHTRTYDVCMCLIVAERLYTFIHVGIGLQLIISFHGLTFLGLTFFIWAKLFLEFYFFKSIFYSKKIFWGLNYELVKLECF